MVDQAFLAVEVLKEDADKAEVAEIWIQVQDSLHPQVDKVKHSKGIKDRTMEAYRMWIIRGHEGVK